MNEQTAVLSILDLILQNAQLVSDDNRLRLADLARRNVLPRDVIRKLQKAGIRVPLPSISGSATPRTSLL